jgi:hypothetical protein
LSARNPSISQKKLVGFLRETTTFSGTQSPIRFPASQPLEFVVKLDTGGYDPYQIVHLFPLAVVKGNRQFLIMKTGAMGFSPRVNDALVALNIARYGESPTG